MISRISSLFEAYAKKKEKLYIVPSREGMLFIGVDFTLFLIGLVYANNLVLLLAFALFASLLLIMFQTHGILEKFAFSKFAIQDAAQGRPVKLFLDPAPDLIHLDLHAKQGVFSSNAVQGANEEGVFALEGLKRGRYQAEFIKIWTKGEQKFFYVWTYRKVSELFYVFPRPKFTPKRAQAAVKELLSRGGQFNRHLRYQQGDQASRIDWKAYARTDQLLVKDYQDPRSGGLLIQEGAFEGDMEDKLSQMAWLVNHCLQRGIDWELSGQGYFLPIDQGSAHWRKSMEVLSEA